MGNEEFRDINYIVDGMSHIKDKFYSGNKKEKCDAAELFLYYWMKRYANFSEEEKKKIDLNVNDLEKKAVEILIKNGEPVAKDLLDKYGYSKKSGDKK